MDGQVSLVFRPCVLVSDVLPGDTWGARASMYLLGPSEPCMDLGVSSSRGASQSPSEAPVHGLSVTPCGRWVLSVSDPLLPRVRDIAVLLEERANIQSLAAPEGPMDGPVEGELEGAAIKRPMGGTVSRASIPRISLPIDRGNTNRAACLVDMVDGFSRLQPVANVGAWIARNVGLGQAGPIDSVPRWRAILRGVVLACCVLGPGPFVLRGVGDALQSEVEALQGD